MPSAANKLIRIRDTKAELRSELNKWLTEYDLPTVSESAIFRAYPAFIEAIALNRPPPLVVLAEGEDGAIINAAGHEV
jgi:hypothetical protein